eukprot:CAMPEP_0176448034 /NCGR_PEP_ID=MMETSP0127-20121128/25487_1 /TAXON_ID=938130 /ORGANISM="Platyophrya macrostoma, Strain WH" /LENGTH=423 /DNA_ID=CAMNT_0017834795 /DNA_START=1 /DNA_END=1272 /DNA_ORIENTATION=+
MLFAATLASFLLFYCSCVSFDNTTWVQTPTEYYIFGTKVDTERVFLQVQPQGYTVTPFNIKVLTVDNTSFAVSTSVSSYTVSIDYNLGGFAVTSNDRGEVIVAAAKFTGLKTQLYIYRFMWNSSAVITSAVTSFTNSTEYAIYTQWAKYYPYAYYIGFQLVQTVYPYVSEKYIARVNQTDHSTSYIAKVLTEGTNSSMYSQITNWECAENATDAGVFRCMYEHITTGNIREFEVNMSTGAVLNGTMSTVVTADGYYDYRLVGIKSLTYNSVGLIAKAQSVSSKVIQYLGYYGKNSSLVELFDVTDGQIHDVETAGDANGNLVVFERVQTPDMYWSTSVRFFSSDGTQYTYTPNIVTNGIPRFQKGFVNVTNETQDQGGYDESKASVYIGRVINSMTFVNTTNSGEKLAYLAVSLVMFVLVIVA